MISNNGKSNLTQLRGYVRGSKLNLNQLIVAGINPVPSNNLERCTCIYNATGLPCDDLFLVGMSVPRLRDYQPFPDRLLWMQIRRQLHCDRHKVSHEGNQPCDIGEVMHP
jgi:hypothetical protein